MTDMTVIQGGSATLPEAFNGRQLKQTMEEGTGVRPTRKTVQPLCRDWHRHLHQSRFFVISGVLHRRAVRRGIFITAGPLHLALLHA